jgi:DNA-directed RNA polymerase specialized sigma24 family protein
MLYYYDDVTYRDLADQLGVSTATVNARLTRARSLLRERLGAGRRPSPLSPGGRGVAGEGGRP